MGDEPTGGDAVPRRSFKGFLSERSNRFWATAASVVTVLTGLIAVLSYVGLTFPTRHDSALSSAMATGSPSASAPGSSPTPQGTPGGGTGTPASTSPTPPGAGQGPPVVPPAATPARTPRAVTTTDGPVAPATPGAVPTDAPVRVMGAETTLVPGEKSDPGQGIDLDAANASGWVGAVACPNSDLYVADNDTTGTTVDGCWYPEQQSGAQFATVGSDAPIAYATCQHQSWSPAIVGSWLAQGNKFCVWTGDHRRAMVVIESLTVDPYQPGGIYHLHSMKLRITTWQPLSADP
jgi:hypothetical protein